MTDAQLLVLAGMIYLAPSTGRFGEVLGLIYLGAAALMGWGLI
jgi:hypothetical protein